MRPDRKLGQHFLRDASVLEEIAALADVKNSAGVLEIGPGEGALTAFIARAGRPITAVDRDPRAQAALRDRFGDNVNFVLETP
jgi:16S rRNA (adenine1518-N6/adenine1519-N6)-dimethyltransferase